jgi:hypothetical protein
VGEAEGVETWQLRMAPLRSLLQLSQGGRGGGGGEYGKRVAPEPIAPGACMKHPLHQGMGNAKTENETKAVIMETHRGSKAEGAGGGRSRA